MRTLTTADLPESLQAPVEALPVTPKTVPVPRGVLTCQHGPACPACVLSAARLIVEHDASLAYTG